MKSLVVLVILSGPSQPTYTVSEPMGDRVCQVMKNAVLAQAEEWKPQSPKPLVACRPVGIGPRGEKVVESAP